MVRREVLIKQLYAIQANIAAALAMLEDDEGPPADTKQLCFHPKDCRESTTVFGGPEQWTCSLCGYEYVEEQGEDS